MNGEHDQGYPPYSMLIEWSVDDNLYIATVLELPGCRTDGRTYAEAAQRGQEAMESWIDTAQDAGEQLPKPRTFSFHWWPYPALPPLPTDIQQLLNSTREDDLRVSQPGLGRS